MKAIKVTAEHKENNPKLFENNQVGEIVPFNPPNIFVRTIEVDNEGEKTLVKTQTVGYNFNTELQQIDGVKEVSTPKYNSETHKLGELIDDVEKFTYKLIPLTAEEIAQKEDAKIPQTISKLEFKTRLLVRHGITNEQVDTIILAIEDTSTRARLQLMWYEADFFERSNPYLYQFAPALGLTETDVTNLFKNEPNDA